MGHYSNRSPGFGLKSTGVRQRRRQRERDREASKVLHIVGMFKRQQELEVSLKDHGALLHISELHRQSGKRRNAREERASSRYESYRKGIPL